MKRIYSAADLPQAHLLAHRLREAGIACHVFNENLQGGVGEIPFTHVYPEIWLEDETQEEQARAIIEAFEQSAPEGPPWICTGCGEENPEGFQSCWACGRERGGSP